MNIAKRLSQLPARVASYRKKQALPQTAGEALPAHHEVNDTWEHTDAKQPLTVRALFAFKAETEHDLAFEPEQIIHVSMKDESWYLGWYVGADGVERSGVFPQNYVETVPESFDIVAAAAAAAEFSSTKSSVRNSTETADTNA